MGGVLLSSFSAYADDFTISVSPVTDGLGKAEISCSWDGVTERVYKAYKSENGGVSYQSVGIDYSEVSEIKLLQIYPCVAAKNQLKTWMETNGYGKGIVKVDDVDWATFNSDPYRILKTGEKWKYDVIFFGTWDSNDGLDLSDLSANATEAFIKSGRGCIFGHDVLGYEYDPSYTRLYRTYSKRLAKYFNIKQAQYLYEEPGYITPLSDYVRIEKLGIFTSYPWKIGEKGDVLHIPAAHNLAQAVKDETNIWLKFCDSSGNLVSSNNSNENFYLTTYNNCAMIMTGHSDGAATDDEQKILANLIFYCNQLISSSVFKDPSAQDLAAPSAVTPSFGDENNTYKKVHLTATDNGTNYAYYVEEYDKANTMPGNALRTSNIAHVCVKTGIDHFLYLIDANAGTAVTKTNGTESDADIVCTRQDNISYLHVAAVDKAGNISATKHIKIAAKDKTAPVINSAVEGSVNAADAGSGTDEYVSGISGYALMKEESDTPLSSDFAEAINWHAHHSGYRYLYAIDKAGNISALKKVYIHSELIYNGKEINEIYYNGKRLDELLYNGDNIYF